MPRDRAQSGADALLMRQPHLFRVLAGGASSRLPGSTFPLIIQTVRNAIEQGGNDREPFGTGLPCSPGMVSSGVMDKGLPFRQICLLLGAGAVSMYSIPEGVSITVGPVRLLLMHT